MERKIPGAAAELGVFRGIFSALINRKFPDKKLYLFDTFEGFIEEEAKKEAELGRCDQRFYEFHANTSVERMLKSIPFPNKCVICKGYFPQSVTEEAKRELRFCIT